MRMQKWKLFQKKPKFLLLHRPTYSKENVSITCVQFTLSRCPASTSSHGDTKARILLPGRDFPFPPVCA